MDFFKLKKKNSSKRTQKCANKYKKDHNDSEEVVLSLLPLLRVRGLRLEMPEPGSRSSLLTKVLRELKQ